MSARQDSTLDKEIRENILTSRRNHTGLHFVAELDVRVIPPLEEVDFFGGYKIPDHDHVPQTGFKVDPDTEEADFCKGEIGKENHIPAMKFFPNIPKLEIKPEDYLIRHRDRGNNPTRSVALVGGAGYGKSKMLRRFAADVMDKKRPQLQEVEVVRHMNFRDIPLNDEITPAHHNVSSRFIERSVKRFQHHKKIHLVHKKIHLGFNQYPVPKQEGQKIKPEDFFTDRDQYNVQLVVGGARCGKSKMSRRIAAGVLDEKIALKNEVTPADLLFNDNLSSGFIQPIVNWIQNPEKFILVIDGLDEYLLEMEKSQPTQNPEMISIRRLMYIAQRYQTTFPLDLVKQLVHGFAAKERGRIWNHHCRSIFSASSDHKAQNEVHDWLCGIPTPISASMKRKHSEAFGHHNVIVIRNQIGKRTVPEEDNSEGASIQTAVLQTNSTSDEDTALRVNEAREAKRSEVLDESYASVLMTFQEHGNIQVVFYDGEKREECIKRLEVCGQKPAPINIVHIRNGDKVTVGMKCVDPTGYTFEPKCYSTKIKISKSKNPIYETMHFMIKPWSSRPCDLEVCLTMNERPYNFSLPL